MKWKQVLSRISLGSILCSLVSLLFGFVMMVMGVEGLAVMAFQAAAILMLLAGLLAALIVFAELW